MSKLFIEDLPIQGKKVLMRVDFNVPLDNELNVADTTRIDSALRSIRYVLDQGGALILMSHLGRPQYEPRPDLSLAPVAKVLSKLLNQPVQMAKDCLGEQVLDSVNALQAKEVLLLENLRFHRAEEHPEEDPEFAKELASFGDLYVNDAFGSAHRKHSSTYTITRYFPGKAAAGYLLQQEMHFLGDLLTDPKRPFYALIGGAKISTKIGVIKSLLKKVDQLFIGGGMAYTFLKAEGLAIGDSLCEEDLIPLAKEILQAHREKIILPIDVLAATECSEETPYKEVKVDEGIPKGYQGLDIGPHTLEMFSEKLKNSHTVLWNGPFGVYEFDSFAQGTLALADTISKLNATTIIGGGDLIAALQGTKAIEAMSHVSTGGGATLEYLESGTLPAIEALSEKKIYQS
ncbi:MAG: phosphoglycerate kinase [Chlamydiales bacterium]